MQLTNQKIPLETLQKYADVKKQALILSGASGVGKTYLAKEYSKMLDIIDFNVIDPKVEDIRQMINESSQLDSLIVVCIENLDIGVPAASFTLLKFLEEPKDNTYIVITCRNTNKIPDTIISRAPILSIPNMTEQDIESYAATLDSVKVEQVKADKTLWRCVKSFQDLDTLIDMTPQNLAYFKNLLDINAKQSVSAITWKMQKFPDGTQVPLEIAVRYMMYSNSSWTTYCLSALNDLALGRIGGSAVLSKLIFELKYLVR